MYMAIAGIASIVIHFLDMNLMRIDLWGPTVGWLIRAGLVVAGLILFLMMPESPEETVE